MAAVFARVRRRLRDALNERLAYVAGGRFAGLCTPTNVSLVLTERCNSRCVHCDIWKNRGREDNPSADQWNHLVSELAAWLGPVQVTMTGGEALLQKFTPELVEHGVACGLDVELLTHGFWRDHSRLERAALANPWRITMSLDGIGPTHSKVRGRSNFWEVAEASLLFLAELREKRGLTYTIRLKTVVMEHNLHSVGDVARFAETHGMEVLYQAIEQNYNTPDDPRWFEHSPNWPRETARAQTAVRGLMRLKTEGYPIANTMAQLELMLPYFENPAALSIFVQSHVAPGRPLVCAATGNLEIRANGDVRPCFRAPAVGNIKTQSIREIWNGRPRWWEAGCCSQSCGELVN